MKVEFITRKNCPLCDEAEEILAGWTEQLGLEVVVVDVDQNAALLNVFTDRVPVLRTESGDVLAEGRWSSQAPAGLGGGVL